MASRFQKQAQVRKLIYAGLILLLFTATLFWRSQVMEAKANTLDLREQDLGEVQLTGRVVQLTLVGSRGIAITFLWQAAIEKQKRQEWNELELLVGAITKLQPHFTAPWLFQSWNLAYNVSVECDRVRDKYFYISRGIELLAEGERQNRNNPDLRFDLGYYYHDKFGSSDESDHLRTLFHLSCIDPVERDPRTLRKSNGQVDPVAFERFCEKHPFLVKRMRDLLHLKTREEVVDFLEENKDVPSRYEVVSSTGGAPQGQSRLKPADQQFPVLPRRADLEGSDLKNEIAGWADDATLPDDFDSFKAAQAWFVYAQEPLPPSNRVASSGLGDYDRNRYRAPRRMTTILFRQYPALGSTFYVQRLQKEGWFDGGWAVDEGRQGQNVWFPERSVVLGQGKWSSEAWDRARRLWEDHGERNGLYLQPWDREAKERRAQTYRDTYTVPPRELGPELRTSELGGELEQSFNAHRELFWYEANRRLTNFHHFHMQAQAERTPEAVQARSLFYKAEQKRKAAEPTEAIRAYEQAFPIWLGVLERQEEFLRDLDVQEETYKLQYDYLKLLQNQKGAQWKQFLLVQDLLTQGAVRPAGVPLYLPSVHVLRTAQVPVGIVGPFDGKARDGTPLLTDEAVRRARSRLGINAPPPMPVEGNIKRRGEQ